MVDHLTGRCSAGAVDHPLPISETGRISATGFREALVVLAPRAALADEALQVSATLDPDGANTDVSPPLEFPRFSDAGAFLPLYRPLDPFTLQLKAQRIARDGTATPIDANALDATFEARLIQGVLGRTIFALGAEKARIRRVAREIGAMRLLSQARLDALDRLGAGLAVPRFVNEIGYDAARKEIVTTALPPDKPEADADYARRLESTTRGAYPTAARSSISSTARARTATRTRGSSRAWGSPGASACSKTTTSSRWRYT